MEYSYILFLTFLFVTTSAYLKPARTIPNKWFQQEAFFGNDDDASQEINDQEVEPSERRQGAEEANEPRSGRVQIKVYRGPYDEHEHFAPHGFWVKQPADHHHG